MLDNLERDRNLHRTATSCDVSAAKLLPYITPFARETAPKTILDFGGGASALVAELAAKLGAGALRYDPSLAEFRQKPADPVDLVICNYLLEQVPEDQLDHVLGEVRAISPKVMFTIATALSYTIAPSGENANRTVRPPKWWRG